MHEYVKYSQTIKDGNINEGNKLNYKHIDRDTQIKLKSKKEQINIQNIISDYIKNDVTNIDSVLLSSNNKTNFDLKINDYDEIKKMGVFNSHLDELRKSNKDLSLSTKSKKHIELSNIDKDYDENNCYNLHYKIKSSIIKGSNDNINKTKYEDDRLPLSNKYNKIQDHKVYINDEIINPKLFNNKKNIQNIESFRSMTSDISKEDISSKKNLIIPTLRDEINKTVTPRDNNSNLKKSLEVKLTKEQSDIDEDKLFDDSDDIDDSEEEKKIQLKHKEKFRKLLKIRMVYDSFSDSEGEEDVDDEVFIIYPNSYFRMYLELIQLINTMYCLTLTPLNLINKGFDYSSLYVLIFELFVDVIFFIDMITSFFTGYYDLEENLICIKRLIIKNYLTGWFILDVITSFPINSIVSYFYYTRIWNDIIISYNKFLLMVRSLRIFKTFFHNKNYIDLSRLFSSSTNSRFLFSFIIFLIITHILACLFIYLGYLDYPNWIFKYGLIDSYFFDVYIASIYFNLASIFTIGYGDILSVSVCERFYNVLLLMIGIMLYSYTVSSLSNYVQDSDLKTRKFENSIAYLDQIKLKYKIKTTLYNKISRFLKYEFTINKIDNNTLLSELPISLRNEVMYFMYHDVINSFLFFKNCDNLDFINKVLLSLKPIRAIKNDILIKEGDLIEETIFVKNGILSLETTINTNKAQITHHDTIKNNSIINKLNELKLKKATTYLKKNTNKDEEKKLDDRIVKIIQIRKNEHFGDVLMFLNQPSNLRVRVKSSKADLFLMKKIDMANIARDFPDIFKKIYSRSVPNMDRIVILINKARNDINKNSQDVDQTQKIDSYDKNKFSLYKIQEFTNLAIKENNRGYSFNCDNNLQQNEYTEDNQFRKLSTKKNKSKSGAKNLFGDLKFFDSNMDLAVEKEKPDNEKIPIFHSDIRFNDINLKYSQRNLPSIESSFDSSESVNISINPSVNEEKVCINIKMPSKKYSREELKIERKIHNESLNINNILRGYKNNNFKIDSGNFINNGNINIFNNYITEEQIKNLCATSWKKSQISNVGSFTITAIKSDTITPSVSPKKSIFEKLNNIQSENPTSMNIVRKLSRFNKIEAFESLVNIEKKGLSPDEIDTQKNSNLKFFKRNSIVEESSKARSNINSTSPAFWQNSNKTEVKERQQKMFTVIKKNILNSNLNINDPGNFYKNWLLEIHNKKLENSEKSFIISECKKYSKRLEKIEDMFKDLM